MVPAQPYQKLHPDPESDPLRETLLVLAQIVSYVQGLLHLLIAIIAEGAQYTRKHAYCLSHIE